MRAEVDDREGAGWCVYHVANSWSSRAKAATEKMLWIIIKIQISGALIQQSFNWTWESLLFVEGPREL